ncbi:importin-7 [Parelaphostrongylus tenuis]|uniref:Importin-7 n=1 Tax=Parelaphostrongylus tenuis TaxID=148309 RepID=A0AAD5MFH8_PARTN|nr:importin-7 [Parelaphostrongylus tenuis]
MTIRDLVINALNATSDPDGQKSAESFLDEECENFEFNHQIRQKKSVLLNLNIARRRGDAEAIVTMAQVASKSLHDLAKDCSKQQGFAPELLNIVCDDSVCSLVRHSASIYFKNNIVRYWEVKDSKFNTDDDDDIDPERCLCEQDKAIIREHIIDAICGVLGLCRTQLCTAIQKIIRADFPKNWPNFADKLLEKIRETSNVLLLTGGLQIAYRLSKVYESKKGRDKDVALPFPKIEPIICDHCRQLVHVQSAEAVSIQIQGLKIFFVITQFSINFEILPIDRIDNWIKFAIDVLDRNCPEELSTIKDEEERSRTVWWKCKKWAAKLLDRFSYRYGSPNHVEEQYVDFAKHFLKKWSHPALESSLAILNARRNNIYVSKRDLIKHVLFPMLSYNDEDEEMWGDNAEDGRPTYTYKEVSIIEDPSSLICSSLALDFHELGPHAFYA